MPMSVSVVVPCYNGEQFLREAIESAVAQTHPPLEVLVVDDGSTDNSAAIAESFGPPVRVIRQPNQGESVARNRAIDEARGDWVAFLDADDVWKPTKLARQLAAVREDVVALHSSYEQFGSDSGVIDPGTEPEAERYGLRRLCIAGSPCAPSTLIVRRSLPARFPIWTKYSEDTIYVLELVKLGRIQLVREPLTLVRRHEDQQSARLSVEVRWHRTIERWLDDNVDQLGPDVVRDLKDQWIQKLVHVADVAYWRRAWSDYDVICDHLRHHPDGSRFGSPRRKRFPAFVYQIRDGLDAHWRQLTAVGHRRS